MNHELLKRVIFDQHEVIRRAQIIPRRYEFDPLGNYVLTGLRRAGKSTMLFSRVRELVASGVPWERIVYIQFEDERLADWKASDFDDILRVQKELSGESGYFFFDEIQNIEGWEKFVRRIADAGERVDITGSNARMLSSQIETTLGGRYLSKHIAPFRFDEYLDAAGIGYGPAEMYSTRGSAAIASSFNRYLVEGGLPEARRYQNPREYIQSVYQKVLLGDVVARANIRNPQALRVMMKKIAEVVGRELSATALAKMLKGLGYSISSDTAIEYLARVKEAYLLFDLHNAHAPFIEREGKPRYYFSDSGLLGLFVSEDDSALLENTVAAALADAYGEALSYLKSQRYGIDIDFYIEGERGSRPMAIQVTMAVDGPARDREVGNLAKLARIQPDCRLVILTLNEEEVIESDSCSIEVLPAWKFFLQELRLH